MHKFLFHGIFVLVHQRRLQQENTSNSSWNRCCGHSTLAHTATQLVLLPGNIRSRLALTDLRPWHATNSVMHKANGKCYALQIHTTNLVWDGGPDKQKLFVEGRFRFRLNVCGCNLPRPLSLSEPSSQDHTP